MDDVLAGLKRPVGTLILRRHDEKRKSALCQHVHDAFPAEQSRCGFAVELDHLALEFVLEKYGKLLPVFGPTMADEDTGGGWPHLSNGGGTDVAENVVYSLQCFARNHHAGELRLATRADLRAHQAH